MTDSMNELNESVFDAIAKDPDAFLVFYGEMLLRDWGDNSAGESVEFWLSGDGAHPFKNFKSSKRSVGGSRFIAFVVEVDDDESFVNQAQKNKLKKAIGETVRNGKHSQHAALVCKQTDFHQYIVNRVKRLDPEQKRLFATTLPHGLYTEMTKSKMQILLDDEVKGELFAKLFLYWWAGIKSRRELDYSPKKFEAFREIENDYFNWNSSRV